MNPRLIKILDIYVERFGGEIIPRLKHVEAEEGNLIREFEGLKEVREDPKFHGDVSSLTHSLQVVNILQRIYGFIYFQENHRKIDVIALEGTLSVLPFKLNHHLDKRIGKHTRKELLFFACIFHDIGKLKNFNHMMAEVERENVRGVTRFIFHADYGRFYFDDELKDIEEKIRDFEGKLAGEQNPIKKQFYEKASSYLVELRGGFEARKRFFEELQLGSAERKYLAFVIKNHMDMLNFFNQFLNAFNNRTVKNGPKLLNSLVKNLVRKVEEYAEYYIDCILLNFCDLLESANSAKKPTGELYLFLQVCMIIFVRRDGLIAGGSIIFKGNVPEFVAKAKPQYNVGALFKAFLKPEALAIKQIVLANQDNVGGALAKAGYQKQIGQIMKVLRS